MTVLVPFSGNTAGIDDDDEDTEGHRERCATEQFDARERRLSNAAAAHTEAGGQGGLRCKNIQHLTNDEAHGQLIDLSDLFFCKYHLKKHATYEPTPKHQHIHQIQLTSCHYKRTRKASAPCRWRFLLHENSYTNHGLVYFSKSNNMDAYLDVITSDGDPIVLIFL